MAPEKRRTRSRIAAQPAATARSASIGCRVEPDLRRYFSPAQAEWA
jgi:hypothetical protein